MKQEVSLKKITVEGYRAVGSINTKMIVFSLRNLCCCCSLLISVNVETSSLTMKKEPAFAAMQGLHSLVRIGPGCADRA